jgi:hypothetical protein
LQRFALQRESTSSELPERIVCYYRIGEDTPFNFVLDLTVMGIFKLIREWSKMQLHLYPNLMFFYRASQYISIVKPT